MKKIFLILILSVCFSVGGYSQSASTNSSSPLADVSWNDIYNLSDSYQPLYQDSLNELKCKNDSLIHLVDSFKTKLFLANYKVEQVKFYVKLCDKKKSQRTFLMGWLHRVLD